MLCCLVCKDCKDTNMRPMELPASHTQATARENSRRVLAGDRAEAKAQRPVERYGNVDHQLKKARVVGMQAQAKKITIDLI
jgi:hypothetical protein